MRHKSYDHPRLRRHARTEHRSAGVEPAACPAITPLTPTLCAVEGSASPTDESADEAVVRRLLARQGISIGIALIPFGLAFGAACASAGLSWGVAVGFSALVFTGASQFAAVSVLAAKGSAPAAVAAGLLLALRCLAYGVVMSPSMVGVSRLRRIVLSQVMIDEAVAIASTQHDHRLRRVGYAWGGASIYVTWNVSTLIGVLLLRDADALISRWGLDATIPAAFLGLVWPRLQNHGERLTAFAGGCIAFAGIPVLPAGLPIIAASLALLAVRPRKAATEEQ